MATYPAVWQTAFVTDLVGIVPRRMALQIADKAGLSFHPLPFQLPATLLGMTWHRRNSASRA